MNTPQRPDLSGMRVAVVSTHYYPEYLARSVRFAQRAARDLQASVCALVANQPSLVAPLSRQATGFDAEAIVHAHDNTGMEFGAYQAGLDAVLRRGDVDWLLVLNDSSSVHQSFNGERLKQIRWHVAWRRLHAAPDGIGQVESIAEPFTIAGCTTRRWMTSNIFALNRPALDGLGRRLFCPEIDGLIAGGPTLDTFYADELDPVLRARISAWLFDVTAPVHWYGAAPLDATNHARFARKARSIVQEMYLAARLERMGAEFLDVRWLRKWQSWLQPWLDRRSLRRRALAAKPT
jgi:hypothetical protein